MKRSQASRTPCPAYYFFACEDSAICARTPPSTRKLRSLLIGSSRCVNLSVSLDNARSVREREPRLSARLYGPVIPALRTKDAAGGAPLIHLENPSRRKDVVVRCGGGERAQRGRAFIPRMMFTKPEVILVEAYVHGYSETEAGRLQDQASTLVELLHPAVSFPAGSRILEPGCGVGAQTLYLAGKNPASRITAFDISPESVRRAREKAVGAGLSNVAVEVADIFNLPYDSGTFDHLFVCFLLEHLQDPAGALLRLKDVLRENGSVTVIEGDHGSYYCHPRSERADLVVRCLVEIQARKRGNSLIGRELYPLLARAGYREVQVSPRMVYVDRTRPQLVEGFTRKTFIAMIEGVREEALSLELTDEETWDAGIADLYRTTREDGTFCYTFFTAVAFK